MARPAPLFEGEIHCLGMARFDEDVAAKHLDGGAPRIEHEGFGPACHDRIRPRTPRIPNTEGN